MNTRKTRGAEHRKQTSKYALFKSKNKKEVDLESQKSIGSKGSVTDEEDQYILKIAKQQSKQKKQDPPTKQQSKSSQKKVAQKREDKTANSTPEKPEPADEDPLEIDDLENILDETGHRFMKNKQLALEMQRSSVSRAGSSIFMQTSLMPKRIMSSRKSNSRMSASQKAFSDAVAKQEIPKASTKKEPKDRSALVGLKRTRKSRDQIYKLQKCYEDSKGKPTKAQLKQLAKDTGLKLQQVYKWYWDTEKKNDKLQKELRQTNPSMRSPLRLSRKILKSQYTDEFGGYSKTWFSDGIKEVQDVDNKEHAVANLLDRKSEVASDVDPADFGMDGLARLVGLDIEAIAVDLAMTDKLIPPTQCHVVQEDDNCEIYRRYKLQKSMKSCSNYSRNSTPNIQKKQIKTCESAKPYKKKGSPIITPNVIRPSPNTRNQNAQASNPSTIIVNKPVYGEDIHKKVDHSKIMFANPNQAGVNNAFQNLFGGPAVENKSSVMQTPSFFDNKHQIKAKPLKTTQRSIFDQTLNPEKRVSSVFSPIPCKPQSQCSIFGVRGDNNTPYTPFDRFQKASPKPSPKPSPVNTGRIFKNPAAPNGLSLIGQNSRKSQNQNGQEEPKKVTPSMFFAKAAPVDQHSSPSLSKNVFNLFPGYNAGQSGFLKQTPTTFSRPAQQYTASPPTKTTMINIFTQPVSCSNFYNSCNGNCNGNESNSSFSRNSPCVTRRNAQNN